MTTQTKSPPARKHASTNGAAAHAAGNGAINGNGANGAPAKRVFYFGKSRCEGKGNQKQLLGGKGAGLVEMERHKHFGMCCGAGGGRMWIEEEPDKRVNLLRTDQALKTDPEAIAVSCPFCMTMLSDGIKAKDLEEKVKTLDVMEIVDQVTAGRA